ncbi:Hypp7992 [Branchiostoma lanceolatum]|uniref:Hypp7992 protein n=1 Tax=Branchiostoma lanceolatum TaxID=7740 RepID=A0A8K0EEA5_BRALA|nr:Hypp7992 [Branchiostoma lanceolatum]
MVPRSQDFTPTARLESLRRAVPWVPKPGSWEPAWRRKVNEGGGPGPGQAIETWRAVVPARPTKLGANAGLFAVISLHLSWAEALQNVLRSRVEDNLPRRGPRTASESGGFRDRLTQHVGFKR